MDWILGILLLLHVGGAILAFGPTFTFPIIGSMARKEPIHANFAIRLNEKIERGLVIPIGLFQAVTGLLLIWRADFDLLKAYWLDLSIILYIAAYTITFMRQVPATAKLAEATATPPPPPAPGAPPPAGPPPHIAALTAEIQRNGMVMTGLLVAIIILMVLGTNGFLGANA
jgi:Predicted integral membrane protein (DUF2269)